MEIRVPYGRSFLTATLPDYIPVDIVEPPQVSAADNPLGVVRSALDNLLGEVDWSAFAESKSVAIAVNDKTRPVPHQHLLPPLIDGLASLGIPDEAITLYIAVGTHPPMVVDEYLSILPEAILNRFRVVSHDSEAEDNLVDLGETPDGTPISINKNYFHADFKIVVGNIEPHQFVGFSGGVKTAAIGLAGMKTINHNHALMTHPDSQLGTYKNNPARQDVEVIGKKINIHLALNAILNLDKEIVHALAGDPLAVMQAGIPLSRQICQVAVSQKYALVIASPGGHPKDINVYQAQKGMAHAARVTRPGGTIILAASCPEGAGSPHYEAWMEGKNSYDQILQQFKAEGFRIGPHKAFMIAREASKMRLLFCSEMDEAHARALLLNPVKDLQTAIDIAQADLQPGERVGILPHASSTIPYVERSRGDL